VNVIHLGVNDIPYSFSQNIGRTKKGKRKGRAYASTTGDVAEILEDKYGVMATFVALHEEEIFAELSDSIQGSLESLLMGAPPGSNAGMAGASAIEAMFQKFLDLKEMDGIVPGVPTAASLAGVNHRLKSKRGPVRPSFVDTGLFANSFRVWAD
jgi:hypothetical protein